MLLGVGVTRGDDAGHVAVIVGKRLCGPSGGGFLGHPEFVEQVARAHDVVVAAVWFVDHAFLFQQGLGCLHRLFQLPVGCRGQFLGLLLLPWLDDKRLCFRIKPGVGVVGQSAQACGVLALQVARPAQQVAEISVPLFKEAAVEPQVWLVLLAQPLDGEDDAQAVPADGGVGQQCMRVGTGTAAAFRQFLRVDVVDVGQAESRPFMYVLLPLAAFEAYGHCKARAGRFLPSGSGVVAVSQEVTVFFGMLLHGRRFADKVNDVCQGSGARTFVRIAFEKADV